MEETDIKVNTDILLHIQDKQNNEILKICENGDFFVKGKFTENDKDLVNALRDFLKNWGYLV